MDGPANQSVVCRWAVTRQVFRNAESRPYLDLLVLNLHFNKAQEIPAPMQDGKGRQSQPEKSLPGPRWETQTTCHAVHIP